MLVISEKAFPTNESFIFMEPCNFRYCLLYHKIVNYCHIFHSVMSTAIDTRQLLPSFPKMKGILFCLLFALVHGRKLESCSFYENVTLDERTLCINSTVYPKVPIVVQPYIYVTELLDFNQDKHSITVSLQMMLKWNDTGVITVGPNKQQK